MKQTPEQPRKAALYLRISLDAEMDGLAIDRQRDICTGIANNLKWDIIKQYVDESISATDSTKVRPAYNQMVQDYDLGLFDAIVCYDLDRLTRQPKQLEEWIERSERRGLLIATANGDANLLTDGGRMYARIKAAVARAEVERKSARQKAAQRQRAHLGKPPKGMRLMGYTTQGDVIEDEAQTVKAIYEAFTHPQHPQSLRSIARALSGEGHVNGITPRPTQTHVISVERAQKRQQLHLKPRPIKENARWNPVSVLMILRNPRYAGYSTYTPKDTQPDGSKRRRWRAQIVRDDADNPIKGTWKPIVSEELWWTVQNILDDPSRISNTSGSTARKYLGSGLYYCGICHERVTGSQRGYRCAKHIQAATNTTPRVGSLMRSGPAIDQFVTELIKARLRQKDILKIITTTNTRTDDGFDAAISEQRAKILRAQHDYEEELIDGKLLKRITDNSTKKIAELQKDRLAQSNNGILVSVLGNTDPGDAFDNASLAIKREIINLLCTITLLPQHSGRKGFNPDSVVVEWK